MTLLMFDEEEDDEEMSPADELYDGIWNNKYVKDYSNITIPETFQIDLSSFVMPIQGKITSPFGQRKRRFHYGTDLKLQKGDTVVAAFEGKVRVRQFEKRGYGYYLVLRHPNGLETVYGHLSKFLVYEDDSVEAGQPIALGGNTGRSTGPHLHFECRFLGQAIDPADIVDFNNFCTYDDSYLFEKYKVNAISVHNNKFTASDSSIRIHHVKNGDTLSTIAKKYGVSVSTLCRLNGIKTTTVLRIGRILRYS
jgi:murein DD-endopeptidase MepM/ murein hydrolase activator NlpD